MLVVVAKEEEEVVEKIGSAIVTVVEWLWGVGLEVAMVKTVIVNMAGRKKLRDMTCNIQGSIINPIKQIKYLSI